MARVFAPIMDVVPTAAKRNFGNAYLDVLEEHTGDDEYTYTTRVDVPEEEWPKVKEKLLAMAKERGEDITELIKLFEENDRSVSFLVDAW